jgi:zinc protease
VKDGVTPEELERTKTRLIADMVYAQDNQSTLARMYGSTLATGLTVDFIKNYPDVVDSLTLDDLAAAARTYFDLSQGSVTGYLKKAA